MNIPRRWSSPFSYTSAPLTVTSVDRNSTETKAGSSRKLMIILLLCNHRRQDSLALSQTAICSSLGCKLVYCKLVANLLTNLWWQTPPERKPKRSSGGLWDFNTWKLLDKHSQRLRDSLSAGQTLEPRWSSLVCLSLILSLSPHSTLHLSPFFFPRKVGR